MKAIICIDENKGMLFNNRRQSRDRILIEKIMDFVADGKIYMSQYSSKLFPESNSVIISENFAIQGENNDFCFIEGKIDDLSLFGEFYCFNWNKPYPADVYFPYDLEKEGFQLISTEDFEGSSHSNITLSIFRRFI